MRDDVRDDVRTTTAFMLLACSACLACSYGAAATAHTDGRGGGGGDFREYSLAATVVTLAL